MLWIDVKYLRMISSRLDGFKEKKLGKLWNCRCPICNDSQKKRSKKRGYFYEYKNSLMMKCFNCNASMPFGVFLKDFDFNLYDQYILEKFKNNVSTNGHHRESSPEVDVDLFKVKPPVKVTPNITHSLRSVLELPESHPVKKYVISRMIPEEFWGIMFYAPKFFTWASNHTDKFNVPNKDMQDQPRLIIPWISVDGVVFGYTARAFGSESPKYFKVILDDSYPHIYGMDRVNLSEKVYVVEGPLDSMFLPNCVAVGTSALLSFNNSDCDEVYITDRDVRNVEIMKIAMKIIKAGKKICLLPLDLPGSDLNELVQNGVKNLKEIVDCNTMQGLEAELNFATWSKVDTKYKHKHKEKESMYD
jgi:hypothetical protein